MPEALLDAVSSGREGRGYVMPVCLFFLMWEYHFELPKQKGTYAAVNFLYEHKEEARAVRTNTGYGP